MKKLYAKKRWHENLLGSEQLQKILSGVTHLLQKYVVNQAELC